MEVKIEKLDDLGRGIAYIDGKVTFVPKTVIGDIVRIEITLEKKKYNEAKLLEIVVPSSKRLNAPCPYFYTCGGCDLQNLDYEDTIHYKHEKITNSFKRSGIEIEPEIIKNPSPYNYRNKVSLKVSNGVIGYYEASSHNIVGIDECLIASKSINKVISHLQNFNINNGEIIIRTNKNEEILLAIKTVDDVNIDIENLKKVCKLVGVVVNDKTIYGDSFLYEMVGGILYRISYDSFFQVNPYVAEKLFEIVENQIKPNDKVLDIYSGVGTLSLNAAKKGAMVVGIEIVGNAVLNAIFNAKINKIINANFVLNDASVAVTKIKDTFNKVIVDPPRSGITKTVVDVILKLDPEELIYVSCNYQTLIRDLKLLQEKCEIKKSYILDMFSYTYHAEVITLLERRDKNH